MAGNQPTQTVKGGVKTFDCPKCGGTVDVRAPGQTLVVSCQFCKSIIDITDERHKLLRAYNSKFTREPTIPLGTRGELNGITWEVIGFMVRKSVKYRHSWDEYLLFNPIHGFRWLVNDSGHWNVYKPPLDKPDFSKSPSKSLANLGGLDYKHFYHGKAEVVYVIGEFYWRVKVGDRVKVQDMIAPPYLLSIEESEGSLNWTKGTYTEPEQIKKAFGKDLKLPRKTGVGPNQPNPAGDKFDQLKPIWIGLLVALMAIMIYFRSTSADEVVFSKSYTINQPEVTYDAEYFTLNEITSNLEVTIKSDVSNEWVEVFGTLNPIGTADNYGFQFGNEYYSGVTDGERWSEGGRMKKRIINSVPPGDYALVIQGFSPGKADIRYTVEIKRDVPMYANFLLILILISVYPLYLFVNKYIFEGQRWENA